MGPRTYQVPSIAQAHGVAFAISRNGNYLSVTSPPMPQRTLAYALIVLSTAAHAQKTDTTTLIFKNELGVEATYFFKQFLNWGNDQLGGYYYALPRYAITYKRQLGSWRLRAGIGGDLSAQTDTGGPNSTTDFDSRSWSLDGRVGIEKAVRAGRKWVVYYGADLAAGHSFSERIQLNPANQSWDQQTEINRYSGGPVLGIQFQLTRHLSLATEASVFLLWERTDRRSWDPEVPGDDEQSYSENGDILLGLPSTVYLVWHF